MNTTTPIYNGLNIRQILSNLPKNFARIHKKQYIKNCLFVYVNESKGFNLSYCNLVRNSNFILINTYKN